MRTLTRYQCEKCRAEFDTEAAAAACEAQPVPPEPDVKVGDDVRLNLGDRLIEARIAQVCLSKRGHVWYLVTDWDVRTPGKHDDPADLNLLRRVPAFCLAAVVPPKPPPTPYSRRTRKEDP
jgi:hypothetical protein